MPPLQPLRLLYIIQTERLAGITFFGFVPGGGLSQYLTNDLAPFPHVTEQSDSEFHSPELHSLELHSPELHSPEHPTLIELPRK